MKSLLEPQIARHRDVDWEHRMATEGGMFYDNPATNGCFYFKGFGLAVIASAGGGWDHVSVQVRVMPRRVPTWEEMVFVKEIFFKDDEAVVNYIPAKKDYINVHPWVLHLWRPHGFPLPMPPKEMV